MRITCTEQSRQLLGGAIIEAFGHHGERASHPVEVVALETTVAKFLVEDAEPGEVDPVRRVTHHVKEVGPEFGLRKYRLEGAVIGRGVQFVHGDVAQSLLAARSQPTLGFLSAPIRNNVEEDGDEAKSVPLAGSHEEVPVKVECAHVAEAFEVIIKGCSVGEDGAVDRVPITAELACHLGDGPAALADLTGCPPTRTIGQLEPRRGDPFVDLGPRTRRIAQLTALESSLAPNEGDFGPGHRQLSERHGRSIRVASTPQVGQPTTDRSKFHADLGAQRPPQFQVPGRSPGLRRTGSLGDWC